MFDVHFLFLVKLAAFQASGCVEPGAPNLERPVLVEVNLF